MLKWLIYKGSPPSPPPPSPPPSPPPDPLYEEEWRKIQWGNKEENLQFVKHYRPHDDDLQQLRILLYGPVGAGKSSFINSVDSVLQGRITGRALADAISGGSFTQKYRTYKIQKGRPGTAYPFAFTDFMGIEHGANGGVCVEDIKKAMKGHVKDGYDFNPHATISEDDNHYNQTPSLNDKVHVLVSLVSTSTLSILDDDSVRKMREVRLAARDMDIPQMAILTKIDEACPEVERNIKNVYKSKYIKKKMEELSAALGLPLKDIFPVKNYHSEIDTEDDMDTLILCALRQMIRLGENFVNSM